MCKVQVVYLVGFSAILAIFCEGTRTSYEDVVDIPVYSYPQPVLPGFPQFEFPSYLQTGFSGLPTFASLFRRRCPLCDSSVYSYCNEKLFHDSCCCHNPNNPYDRLPYQCQFADCSFLHANTCPEHKLITACCCTGTNVPYYEQGYKNTIDSLPL